MLMHVDRWILGKTSLKLDGVLKFETDITGTDLQEFPKEVVDEKFQEIQMKLGDESPVKKLSTGTLRNFDKFDFSFAQTREKDGDHQYA